MLLKNRPAGKKSQVSEQQRARRRVGLSPKENGFLK